MCFSPVGQQLYLCVLVSLHLAVGLSVSSQPLLHTLFCSRLLVFKLLLQLINPGVINTSHKIVCYFLKQWRVTFCCIRSARWVVLTFQQWEVRQMICMKWYQSLHLFVLKYIFCFWTPAFWLYLCTSCVFSCFSLDLRSPFIKISFSSSATFFSR